MHTSTRSACMHAYTYTHTTRKYVRGAGWLSHVTSAGGASAARAGPAAPRRPRALPGTRSPPPAAASRRVRAPPPRMRPKTPRGEREDLRPVHGPARNARAWSRSQDLRAATRTPAACPLRAALPRATPGMALACARDWLRGLLQPHCWVFATSLDHALSALSKALF